MSKAARLLTKINESRRKINEAILADTVPALDERSVNSVVEIWKENPSKLKAKVLSGNEFNNNNLASVSVTGGVQDYHVEWTRKFGATNLFELDITGSNEDSFYYTAEYKVGIGLIKNSIKQVTA